MDSRFRISDENLVATAIRTYVEAGGRIRPLESACQVRTDSKRRRYIILANSSAILEVYRLDPGGRLRSTKNYPAAVTQSPRIRRS